MNLNIYNSSVFQGSLRKKNYFEGWYFKHVSSDLRHVILLIPGISLNHNDPHAFIQVLDGITGESEYLKYPLSEFSWEKSKFYIRIGNSVFTDEYISPEINGARISINGRVAYHDMVRYPKSLLSPGIMGWYSFVPLMECRHGIVSVNQNLSGNLYINEKRISFDGGKGYIEKDWGISFPEAWLWIQANNFSDSETSFCFSVAKIPWRGKYFIGFIAFLYYLKKFYLFSTYNNSIIREIRHTKDTVFLVLANKNNILRIFSKRNLEGELKAPVSGDMSRRIKESNDSTVSIELCDSDEKIIYTDSSTRAGIEVIEKIFDYLS